MERGLVGMDAWDGTSSDQNGGRNAAVTVQLAFNSFSAFGRSLGSLESTFSRYDRKPGVGVPRLLGIGGAPEVTKS